MNEPKSQADNNTECQQWMKAGDEAWAIKYTAAPIIYNKAADCYRKAIACNKQHAPAWVGLAECLQRGAQLQLEDVQLLNTRANIELSQEDVNEITTELFVHALMLDVDCKGPWGGLEICKQRSLKK